MKKLTLLTTAILLTACNSTPKEQPVVFSERNQEANKGADLLNNHAVKVNIAESYCNGSKVVHYYEATTYYSFRCEDGRYFNLSK